MYKQDLSLNDLLWLICHKIWPHYFIYLSMISVPDVMLLIMLFTILYVGIMAVEVNIISHKSVFTSLEMFITNIIPCYKTYSCLTCALFYDNKSEDLSVQDYNFSLGVWNWRSEHWGTHTNFECQSVVLQVRQSANNKI